MTTDQRLQVIRRAVAEVVAFEGEVGLTVERARLMLLGPPDVLVAIERFASLVQMQRNELAGYLKDSLSDASSGGLTTAHPTSAAAVDGSALWRDLSSAFSRCAISYTMLHEMALRLYEPRLREIAPRHLKASAEAALCATRLLPTVVAWQLAQEGLHCSCICPMCGLGACGCVALGTQTTTAAWRDAARAESAPEGFVLQAPRPASELGQAGLQGGDLLIAIDGQAVRAVPDIQAAIRKHALGDELRLRVQRDSEPSHEITVRHVSDYPKP
jgi:PDZ domain-containing protein